MSKIVRNDTVTNQARWEGGEAAQEGRGRSTNPYPHSDMPARDAWFAGYDQALTKLARQAGKRR
jgi:ribosome modulation factor